MYVIAFWVQVAESEAERFQCGSCIADLGDSISWVADKERKLSYRNGFIGDHNKGRGFRVTIMGISSK